MASIYCIDTSSLIWAHRSSFTMDIAPRFWELMNDAFKSGTVISNIAIYDEIVEREGDEDDLARWVKERKDYFPDLTQVAANNLATIMSKCPKLVNPLKKKHEADPYVIATAMASSATVVTQETPNGLTAHTAEIPDVCKTFNIECINLLTMMRKLGWKL